MMLFRYEYKKTYSNKAVIVIILLFFIMNGLCAFENARKIQENNNFQFAIDFINDQLDGTITKDKVDFVVSESDRLSKMVSSGDFSKEQMEDTYTGYIYGDNNLFSIFRNEFDRIYNYPATLDEVIHHLQANIQLYSSVENQAMVRQSEKLLSLYNDRNITEYHDYTGVKSYLNYDMSFLLVSILAVIIISPIFSYEKEAGMQRLLNTSVNGHSVKITKWCFSFFNIIILAIVFFMEDVFVFASSFQYFPLHVPLYYLDDYALTFMNCTTGGLISLTLVMKIFGIAVLSSLYLMISRLFSSSARSMVISFILLSGLILFAQFKNDLMISPISFAWIKERFRTPQYVNLLGFQILNIFFMMISGITMIAFSSFMTLKKSGEIK